MDLEHRRNNKAVHIALMLTESLGTAAFKRIEWITAVINASLREWENELDRLNTNNDVQEGDKPSDDGDT